MVQNKKRFAALLIINKNIEERKREEKERLILEGEERKRLEGEERKRLEKERLKLEKERLKLEGEEIKRLEKEKKIKERLEKKAEKKRIKEKKEKEKRINEEILEKEREIRKKEEDERLEKEITILEEERKREEKLKEDQEERNRLKEEQERKLKEEQERNRLKEERKREEKLKEDQEERNRLKERKLKEEQERKLKEEQERNRLKEERKLKEEQEKIKREEEERKEKIKRKEEEEIKLKEEERKREGLYEGSLFNNNRQGFGIMKYTNGDIYGGDWTDDKREGKGYIIKKGIKYTGSWENDIPVNKHIMIYEPYKVIGKSNEDFEKYIKYYNYYIYDDKNINLTIDFIYVYSEEVTFSEKIDILEGTQKISFNHAIGGKISYGNEFFIIPLKLEEKIKEIEDKIKSDLQYKGVWPWPSSSIISNEVYYGKIKKNRSKYGKYDRHDTEGVGIMKYKNGDVYEGNWKDDKRDGTGTITYKNGDKYEGEWKNDGKVGTGIMKYNNGDIYEGKWENGQINGVGTMIYNNGYKYKGNWENGMKKGKGKIFFNKNVYDVDYFGGETILKYNSIKYEGDMETIIKKIDEDNDIIYQLKLLKYMIKLEYYTAKDFLTDSYEKIYKLYKIIVKYTNDAELLYYFQVFFLDDKLLDIIGKELKNKPTDLLNEILKKDHAICIDDEKETFEKPYMMLIKLNHNQTKPITDCPKCKIVIDNSYLYDEDNIIYNNSSYKNFTESIEKKYDLDNINEIDEIDDIRGEDKTFLKNLIRLDPIEIEKFKETIKQYDEELKKNIIDKLEIDGRKRKSTRKRSIRQRKSARKRSIRQRKSIRKRSRKKSIRQRKSTRKRSIRQRKGTPKKRKKY